MAGLDAEELLHLGLHASQQGDPAKAIEYLKQCLSLQPDNPNATYMLGALYAQIGIYDRAKETLARAVNLNAAQPTAAFQLGLLHLTSGEVPQATEVWKRLDALAPEHALNRFRFGLLALVRDEFAACISLLEQGIEANSFNDMLNQDMARVKASAEAAQERSGRAGVLGDSADAVGRGQHLLGVYGLKNRH